MSGSGPTTHEPLIYYIGDTIMIDVSCTDAKGAVLPLTGAQVEWLLNDANGSNVVLATLGNGIEIATTPEAGKIEITVMSAITDNFQPGFYQDQLRVITADGYESTQMVGLIEFKSALGRSRVLAADSHDAGVPIIGSPDLEIPT